MELPNIRMRSQYTPYFIYLRGTICTRLSKQGITFGDRFLEIGLWRLGDVPGMHFNHIRDASMI